MCKRLFSALLGLLLLCAPAPARAAAVDRMAGIDISVYQGDVDFETARDNGVEVVYIRASYGSDGVDSALYSHYEGARAAGRKLGFYHYLTALDTESARAQAGFFAGLIRNLDYDCRPALDFEVYRGLDRDQATAVAAAFLEALENELDVTPMLYADAYVAKIREAGSVWAVPVIDLNSISGLYPVADSHVRYFSDGQTDRLHPNAAGHERMAKALAYQLLAFPACFD